MNPEDKEKFVYNDLYLLAEIKDELNRITSGDNVKHIFGTDIFKYIKEKGYVEERNVDGRLIHVLTENGQEKGIVLVEQTSKIGTVYNVIKYPQQFRKRLLIILLKFEIIF